MAYKTFSFFVYFITVISINADKCLTPNNETAECVSLTSCPIIANALTDLSSREFVRQSICGGTEIDPLVCCGTTSNFTKPEGTRVDVDLNKILPPLSVCGLQHSDDYFHTVNGTVVSDFPWIALIEFRFRNDSNKHPPQGKYQCSGSLINNHYILTAAQCLTHAKYKAVAVRLGEYNIKNETDCVDDANVYECADPAIDYDIEATIPHPNFILSLAANDIGLIKIKENIIYSDYIRPICLPLPTGLKKGLKAGNTLITSGWGKKKLYTDDYIETKKITFSKLITNGECSEKYAQMDLNINENLMCSVLRNDSVGVCYGDAGGPVMITRKRHWYQVAIVAYGEGCQGDYPEVFTKVEPYLDWILKNLN